MTVSSKTTTSVSLSWSPVAYSWGIEEYEIFRDGVSIGTTTSTNYTNSGLSPATAYTYQVKAIGANGKESTLSPAVTGTTDAPKPATPTGLKTTAVTDTTISLAWDAVTYSYGGIKEYEVFRDGVSIGKRVGTSFADSGLTASTSYAYRVKAIGNNNISSDLSATFTATTNAGA